MWDINLKATNEQDKQRLMDMDYRLAITRGQGVREEQVGRWLNWVKYRGMEERIEKKQLDEKNEFFSKETDTLKKNKIELPEIKTHCKS